MSLYVLVIKELGEAKHVEHSAHSSVILDRIINFMEEQFCFEGCTAKDIMDLGKQRSEDMFVWINRINKFLETTAHSTFQFSFAISTNLDAQ